ncbi:DUF1737 domain-containing protein [bacterium]|nr:DUF1737 domain-containing protein [bacterium]
MDDVMSRKMKYHVIREYTLAKLEIKVSGYLEDGWITCGGVSASLDEKGVKFYMQAMMEPKQ